MKSHIKGLQGEKWGILQNGFLTTESLSKLQKGKDDLHELAKEFFKKPRISAILSERVGVVKKK